MEVKGSNALVVGLGRSGVAAANFLLRRGARVTVSDRRSRRELAASIGRLAGPARLSVGTHRLEDFLEADFVVLSPGVPSGLPQLRRAREKGIPVYSEVELAYRFLAGNVVGITGSNGKTTTTTLIGQLLEGAGHRCVVAGNIGSPLIQWVDSPDVPSGSTFVVELSSFQLENILRFRCQIALVLNVTPDHQDRYPSFRDYLQAKEQILRNQGPEDHAVLNADDPHTLALAARCRGSVFLFSRRRVLESGFFIRDGRLEFRWKGRSGVLMPVADLKLRGGHNQENVLAAAAVGVLLGLDPGTLVPTLQRFRGVEHRLEEVATVGGVSFYNDSKATNLESARRALEAFSEPVVLIMGGRSKGGDFGSLRRLARRKLRGLVVLGESGEEILDSLGDVAPVLRARDLGEAVEIAYREARPGDVVLLSPGCASFDMFQNFEHRGRVFKAAVAGLGAPHGPPAGGGE